MNTYQQLEDTVTRARSIARNIYQAGITARHAEEQADLIEHQRLEAERKRRADEESALHRGHPVDASSRRSTAKAGVRIQTTSGVPVSVTIQIETRSSNKIRRQMDELAKRSSTPKRPPPIADESSADDTISESSRSEDVADIKSISDRAPSAESRPQWGSSRSAGSITSRTTSPDPQDRESRGETRGRTIQADPP